MDEYNFLQELSNDLGELFSSGNNCDVIIQAEENDNKKEFYTHSLILCSRSTYFKAALSKNWIHNENGMIIFKKPNISPEIMNHLLKYLYSGIIELDKQRGVNVFKLFIASDELGIKKLSEYILNYIIGKYEIYIKEDPIDILQIIFKYEHFNSLRNNCLEFISENPKIFFESTKFLSIEKSILIKLIQRDDLEIHDEYEIWNYIKKKGIERMSSSLTTTENNNNHHNNIDNNNIDINNFSNWNLENFFELKNILHDFLLHIRWFQISSKIFYQQISPFKPIFPDYLYKDIITKNFKYFSLKPRKSIYCNSKIITKFHLPIFSSWIDYKEKNFYNIKTMPYHFELLYRASRDGFSSTNFHNLCDNKGSTIIICKLKDNGTIIGGYNPNSWNCNDNEFLVKSEDSYLFYFNNNIILDDDFDKSFTDDDDEPIIARLANKNYDKYLYNSNYGPTFGTGFDLIIENDIIKCDNITSYPKLLAFINPRQIYFLEDYEVYKVTK
ncbi:hypothetical protein RhiirA1_528871 [Rhizophagus irregularis]|uniref:Serine-enriched protein n=1 Tax=Rhizophagus irregularis TaxID=588596 RepID=A0A2N0SID9_9GLOM|nr:hypothetical protein RhiirA1_528871 [Rhizophagus irregularis]